MYRIFIVEDDAGIAQGIREQIEQWGMEAHCAADFRNVMAEFAACSQSSVSLEKVDVKHILLLFGGEEADPLDERLIGYSGANRAMVCFPQTSEPFVRMGE